MHSLNFTSKQQKMVLVNAQIKIVLSFEIKQKLRTSLSWHLQLFCQRIVFPSLQIRMLCLYPLLVILEIKTKTCEVQKHFLQTKRKFETRKNVKTNFWKKDKNITKLSLFRSIFFFSSINSFSNSFIFSFASASISFIS